MLIQNIDQFRKCRCHIHTFFILNSLQALTKYFFYDHCIFFYILIIFVKIQEQRNKRRLSIGRHQCIDLVLNGLYTGTKFIFYPFLYHTFKNRRIHTFTKCRKITVPIFIGTFSQIFSQMTYIYRLSTILAARNR